MFYKLFNTILNYPLCLRVLVVKWLSGLKNKK